MMQVAASLTPIAPGAWITPPPLRDATVAIITTSGIHRRSDRPFQPGVGEYRLIPDTIDPGELVMSHMSVNFDRTAFQQDPNVMFPLARLQELARDGNIGGVSRWHYSFMGAVPTPLILETTGQEVGQLLRDDGVDVAVLAPV